MKTPLSRLESGADPSALVRCDCPERRCRFHSAECPRRCFRNEIALSGQETADLILCAGDGEAETIVAEIEAGGVGANVITEDLVFVGARLDEVDAVPSCQGSRCERPACRRRSRCECQGRLNAAGRVGVLPGFR